MSDKKSVIGDEMVNAKLKAISKKLNISIDDLINQYIKRGLYRDLYYEDTPLSKKRLSEVIKINRD